VRRFRTSQNPDGGWGYAYKVGGTPESPAMTCVGLIGLAVGLDLAGAPARQGEIDPAILRGFVALSKHIGAPLENPGEPRCPTCTCCGPSSASRSSTACPPSPTRTGIAGPPACSSPISNRTAAGRKAATPAPTRSSTPAWRCS